MKQAERIVKRMTDNHVRNYVDNHEFNHEQSLYRLKSAREKYRSLRYEYTIQSSILILVAFTAVAVVTSYLFGGV